MISNKNLETFFWVARLGSFSAAAHRLDSTQPAVSKRIRELEKTLGTPVFAGTRRGPQLTFKGQELVGLAEKMLSLTAEIVERMGDARSFSGRVKVGVSETIALTWLPNLVARLNDEYPNVIVEVDVDLTENLWRKLDVGALELVMLPGPVVNEQVEAEFLGSVEYVWMASPKLDISSHPKTPRDLQAWPVITLSSASNMSEIMFRWFQSEMCQPRRLDVCNSLSVVAALTMLGLGISLLPPKIFGHGVGERRLRVLRTKPPIQPIDYWACCPRRRISSIARLITDHAKAISTFDRAGPPADRTTPA